MSVIPATWEVEIGRSKVNETPISSNKSSQVVCTYGPRPVLGKNETLPGKKLK
jgi:hypothetical protein